MLPKDATPEQVSAYRKENGIPEKPEGYFDALSPEIKATLDDDTKAVITPFLGLIQKHNLSPQAAAEFIQLRQAEARRFAEERNSADVTLRAQTEEVLRGEWGANYRAEVNNILGLLQGAPEEVRESFMQARTPDGNALFGTPEALRWFAQLARTVNPYSVPVGADGGTLDGKGVEARIGEIERWMGATKGSADHKRYYGDERVQTEYRQLLDAREKMRQRAA